MVSFLLGALDSEVRQLGEEESSLASEISEPTSRPGGLGFEVGSLISEVGTFTFLAV